MPNPLRDFRVRVNDAFGMDTPHSEWADKAVKALVVKALMGLAELYRVMALTQGMR